MTRDEWLSAILRKVAAGFMDPSLKRQAADYLAGKEPPDLWEPQAVKKFKESK